MDNQMTEQYMLYVNVHRYFPCLFSKKIVFKDSFTWWPEQPWTNIDLICYLNVHRVVFQWNSIFIIIIWLTKSNIFQIIAAFEEKKPRVCQYHHKPGFKQIIGISWLIAPPGKQMDTYFWPIKLQTKGAPSELSHKSSCFGCWSTLFPLLDIWSLHKFEDFGLCFSSTIILFIFFLDIRILHLNQDLLIFSSNEQVRNWAINRGQISPIRWLWKCSQAFPNPIALFLSW